MQTRTYSSLISKLKEKITSLSSHFVLQRPSGRAHYAWVVILLSDKSRGRKLVQGGGESVLGVGWGCERPQGHVFLNG